MTRAARIEDDHVAEVRGLGGDGHRLVDLLLILAEEHDAARVAQDVGDLGGRVGLVDADRARAQGLGREIGEQPLDPVVAEDRDVVTVNGHPHAWHALDTLNYNVNLYHFAWALSKPTSNAVFWAVTVVNSPREMQNVRLAIGSNAASRWWLNGEPVIALNDDRQSVIDDGVSKRVTLRKGRNVIRAAIINGGGATDFCARFLDESDNPIRGLEVSL